MQRRRGYIEATRVNAADGRSLKLLEDLVSRRPELTFEVGTELEFCQKAVGVAADDVRLEPLGRSTTGSARYAWGSE